MEVMPYFTSNIPYTLTIGGNWKCYDVSPAASDGLFTDLCLIYPTCETIPQTQAPRCGSKTIPFASAAPPHAGLISAAILSPQINPGFERGLAGILMRSADVWRQRKSKCRNLLRLI